MKTLRHLLGIFFVLSFFLVSAPTVSAQVPCNQLGPDDTIPDRCNDAVVNPLTPKPIQSCNDGIVPDNYDKCCVNGMGPFLPTCSMSFEEKCRKGFISCRPGTFEADAGVTPVGTPPKTTGGTAGYPAQFQNYNTVAPQSSTSALQSCTDIKFISLFDILVWAKCIIASAIIPLIFALAFMAFLWGVLKFIYASDLKQKEESKQLIWWGLIGLFVMVSVWGIINILSTTFGTGSTVPLLQTSSLKKGK